MRTAQEEWKKGDRRAGGRRSGAGWYGWWGVFGRNARAVKCAMERWSRQEDDGMDGGVGGAASRHVWNCVDSEASLIRSIHK